MQRQIETERTARTAAEGRIRMMFIFTSSSGFRLFAGLQHYAFARIGIEWGSLSIGETHVVCRRSNMQLLIETERTARLAAEGRTGWIRIIIICLASYSSRNVLAFKGFFFEHAMFNKGCDVPPPLPEPEGQGRLQSTQHRFSFLSERQCLLHLPYQEYINF